MPMPGKLSHGGITAMLFLTVLTAYDPVGRIASF